ncbi:MULTISPECIES: hypothetical protein [unclassified Endozoicomonas]|uniref:hypothetical protein n=1 Tax=unclassified Endozoicomonas TaxID=2644528 RepID=UPI003BB6B1D9
MNYQSTDAFAGGGRGFGLVNSAIDANSTFATASLCVGMHTSSEKQTLQREMGMGSYVVTQRG